MERACTRVQQHHIGIPVESLLLVLTGATLFAGAMLSGRVTGSSNMDAEEREPRSYGLLCFFPRMRVVVCMRWTARPVPWSAVQEKRMRNDFEV